jgi:hemerythrin-like domain-containing protein
MKNPLDSLRKEHDVILSVIDRLEAAANCARDGRLPRDYVNAVLDFIRIYIDESHHAKEERALFVEMKADPFLIRFADTLTSDHEDGRWLVAAIERALREDGPVVPPILTYSAFIRDHIRREEEMIFEAVSSTLGDAALENLARRFREVETPELARDTLDRLLDAAYEPAER